jgi:DNA-binding NtrC family response regulator/tetratricopeptide (TPR) repeat protein
MPERSGSGSVSGFTFEVGAAEDAGARAVLETEALWAAGRTSEVGPYLAGLGGHGIGESTQVRLSVLHGMALFELGDVVGALDHLRDAAERSQQLDIKTQFSTALALFSREAQFQSPQQALTALSRLRQLAATAGDALSLGNLHLVVARLEGCRGHCVNARRHLEISRSLFSIVDKPALKIMLALVDSSMEMYSGDLARVAKDTRQRNSPRQGRDGASLACLSIPLAGSLTNLGSVLLFTGHAEQARECLGKALSLSSDLLLSQLGTLDSLAQVALHTGQLDVSREMVQRCSQVAARQRLPARSWYDLAHQVTRALLWERLEDWEGVVELAVGADAEVSRRQYKAVRTSLLCAKARALAHLGKHAQAEAAIGTAVRVCPRGAVDPLIVLEGSKAICLSLRGDVTNGSVHFDRALAACRAIGHKFHEAWLDRERQTLAKTLRESIAVPQRQLEISDTALLVSDVATILGAGHSIDLLAHRTAAILQNTAMAPRVEVRTEAGHEYRPEPTSTSDVTADGAFRITLRGSDRAITIQVRDAHAIDEVSLLKGLADLVQAAVNRTTDTESEDEDQNLWPRTPVADADGTVFRSPRMVELLKIAARLAATDLPVLISGETGTGKEIFARLIHDHSLVKRGPFVAFNSTAIPRELVESQLFGHRRGAFTGATDTFQGLVRTAERGTLFLDEVGDLDPAVQPKLLRFLENAEIQPVGDARPQRVTVRIVAATNANIDDLVEQGRFRRDLFYRLGVARLTLPPLRERKDEIPALAALFVARCARECRRNNLRLGDDCIAALLLYDWPGNIRQLANEIRRIVALASDGDTLTSADLAPEIRTLWNDRPAAAGASSPGVTIRLDQTLAQATDELERAFIARALQATGGHVAQAAEMLGLSRKGLFLKRRRQGMVGG